MKTIEMREVSDINSLPNRSIDDRLRQYLEETVVRETNDGPVEYQLLCGAMETEDGHGIAIRKALYRHNWDPKDWMVVTWKPGETPVERVVVAARTTVGDNGDSIELELPPDREDRGNYIVQFGVDNMYGPNGMPISVGHRPYYGRGVGPQRKLQSDLEYDQMCEALKEPDQDLLAEVIDLDDYRRDVGRTAVNA